MLTSGAAPITFATGSRLLVSAQMTFQGTLMMVK